MATDPTIVELSNAISKVMATMPATSEWSRQWLEERRQRIVQPRSPDDPAAALLELHKQLDVMASQVGSTARLLAADADRVAEEGPHVDLGLHLTTPGLSNTGFVAGIKRDWAAHRESGVMEAFTVALSKAMAAAAVTPPQSKAGTPPPTTPPYSYGSRDVQPGYESSGPSSDVEPWGKDPWADDD